MELVKNYAYAKSKVNLTYFRDSNAKEIDVFVEENNVIHPLEIKKSAAPDRREVKKYSVIDKASLKRGNGGIICMCEEPIPIDADNCFIPSKLISTITNNIRKHLYGGAFLIPETKRGKIDYCNFTYK